MRVAMVLPSDGVTPWRSIAYYAENIARGLPGCEVTTHPALSFPAWRDRSLDRAALRSQVAGVEVVHLTHQALTPFSTALTDLPVVASVHDFIPQLFLRRRLRGRLWAWRLDRQLRGLDQLPLLIANSECTRRDTTARLGIPAERIRVLAVPIHPHFFEPPAAPVAADVRQPFLLSVGEVTRHKGLPVLLAAVATDALRNVSLVRVGPPLTPRQRELAARMGVSDRVIEKGSVPLTELRSLLASAAALVQPSMYEGFGMPVAEALAAGTPVVCSDGGALPEVAGDAAIVVPLHGADLRLNPPPGDYVARFAAATAHVLSDASLREDLTGRGKERARRFHPSAVGPLALELYEETRKIWSAPRR